MTNSAGQAQFLLKVSQGDPSAVQACIKQYSGLVWSVARRYCGNLSDAEDAVQEVFIEVWKNAHKYNPQKGSEQVFIMVIARRRIIDRLRKQNRELSERAESLSEPETTAASTLKDTNFHADLERSVEAERAFSAMQRLSDEQKTVLELGIVKGLSHSEIASEIDMSLGTVKSHARRGLNRLRKLLETDTDSRESGT